MPRLLLLPWLSRLFPLTPDDSPLTLYTSSMTRLLFALLGVILLAVTALALVWLAGQLLLGLGVFVVGAAGVLGRLLWYLAFTGVLAGIVFFVASAWRPASRVAPVQAQVQVRPAKSARTRPVKAKGFNFRAAPASTSKVTQAATEALGTDPPQSSPKQSNTEQD